MKVLVIDDNKNHQQSAWQTLGNDHDLMVVGSHEEAMEQLGQKHDEDKCESLRAKYKSEGMDGYEAYLKAEEESRLPYWDAVLSDLLMPAGRMAQGGPGLQYVGTEMSVGWALAIQASLAGARYVAVASDMNHHHHPASAMLDHMDRSVFELSGAKALFTNHVLLVGLMETSSGKCEECSGAGEVTRNNGTKLEFSEACYSCGGCGFECSEKGKHWADILKRVMEGDDLKE